MYLPPALAALAFLALRASAFLIPPTPNDVAVTGMPEQEDGRRMNILAGLPHVIALDCPDCTFDEREGVENKIYLQFEASRSRGLVINDVSVLPRTLNDPSPVSVAAYQMSLEHGEVTAEQPLDFALERLDPISSRQGEGVVMIPVRFTVLAIGGSTVKTDTVLLRLLRTEKELVLLDTKLIPFEQTPGAEACDGSQGWSMCRIKAIVMARVKGMMEKMAESEETAKGWVEGGCGGRFAGQGGPKGFGWMGGRRSGPHPHHAHHGHHAHRHWRSHRFHKALHRTIRFFFIPALLGIIGGLMANAVGMLVGQILVYLWQHFYRRSQRQARPRVIEIVVGEDEKAALMNDDGEEDAPPMYHDIEAVMVEDKR